MANSVILFYPKRRLLEPDPQNQLQVGTALTTDNVTSVVSLTAIPVGTAASGYILVTDDLGTIRRLHYSSWSGSTFTIDTTDGSEDFATTNASVGSRLWITDLNINNLYQLDITLDTFDMSEDALINETKTMSGRVEKVFYYEKKVYNCSTLPSGLNNEPTTAEMEMFLSSVQAGEVFYQTNLDEDDRNMTVKLQGRGVRQRTAINYVGSFKYSYTIREI